MENAMRLLCLSLVLFAANVAIAQEPTEQHESLKYDVGTWTGTMTMNVPGADAPMTMEVKETNKMLTGDLWLLSEFEAGPFKGHGQFGYDASKKQYVGTWIDNMSSHLNVMKGKLDEAKGEMVMTFKGINQQTGEPQQMKSVTTRKGEDQRNFVMYAKNGDKWDKSFEITYKRSK